MCVRVCPYACSCVSVCECARRSQKTKTEFTTTMSACRDRVNAAPVRFDAASANAAASASASVALAAATTNMAKITATLKSTSTAAAAAAAVVNDNENKFKLAEQMDFSYQRTAKQTSPTSRQRGDAEEKRKLQLQQLQQQRRQLRKDFFKDIYREEDEEETLPEENHRTEKIKPKRERKHSKPEQNIKQLINKFQAMIVKEKQQQEMSAKEQKIETTKLEEKRIMTADEGMPLSGLSPYSSDNEEAITGTGQRRSNNNNNNKPKVTRCSSSDSALGLEVDDAAMEVTPPPPTQRRMTLTVTDLPLRPALLPLAEPTALPDSPLTSPTTSTAAGIPTKVLLEERMVPAPVTGGSSSRRESTQSCLSDLGGLAGVRYVRTPSVVVSDYSDDITACGISMEEMEYFRLQRAKGQRRCSLEAGASATGSAVGSGMGKDEGQISDVSAASSCSNLYYCGSTISALDGGECIVNGVRVALAGRKSSSTTQSGSGSSSAEEEDDDADDDDDDDDDDVDADVEVECIRHGEQELNQRQLSELLAATQLCDQEGFKQRQQQQQHQQQQQQQQQQQKKVGSTSHGEGNSDGVTINGNLNL